MKLTTISMFLIGIFLLIGKPGMALEYSKSKKIFAVKGQCQFTIVPLGKALGKIKIRDMFFIPPPYFYTDLSTCIMDLTASKCPSISAEEIYDFAVLEGLGQSINGVESIGDTAFFKPVCTPGGNYQPENEPQEIPTPFWTQWEPKPVSNIESNHQDLEYQRPQPIKKNPDSMGPVVHPNNLDQILKILWFALLAAIVIGLMILAAPLEIIAGIAGCILLMFGVLKSVDTPNLPEYTVNSIAKDLSSFSATITYVDQSFFIDGELQEDGDPRVCVEEVETSNVTCLDRTKLLSAKKYYNKLTQLYSTVTSWIWR